MRGAIVGCGYVSQFHLRAWRQVPSVSIEAACDLDARRAQARAAEFAVPRTCSDAARMLDEVRPHFLDVASVFTRTRRISPALAGEDLAVVLMEFADQGLGLLDLNWASISPGRDHRWEGYPFRIEGEHGALDLGPRAAIQLTRDGEPRRTLPYELPQDPYLDSHRACQAHFIECLHTGEPFATGAGETYHTMATVFAAYESAERGQAVEVRATPRAEQRRPWGEGSHRGGANGRDTPWRGRKEDASAEPGCTRP